MIDSNRPIDIRRVRNVPEILNASLDFIRLSARGLFKSLFFIALPPILVATTFVAHRFLVAFQNIDLGYDPFSEIWSLLPVTLLSALVVAAGSSLVIGVVHSYVELYDETGELDFPVTVVWSRTRESFWMLLFTNIGLSICLLVAYTLSVFIPFAGIFGFLALLSYGVLYYPYRIYHRRGFFQSFILSTKLVQGKWPSTFGLVLLLYILTTMMSGLFFIPIIIAFVLESSGTISLEGIFSGSLGSVLGAAVVSIYVSASQLLWAVPILCMIFLFHSQRERKEAISLQDELELIGQPIE